VTCRGVRSYSAKISPHLWKRNVEVKSGISALKIKFPCIKRRFRSTLSHSAWNTRTAVTYLTHTFYIREFSSSSTSTERLDTLTIALNVHSLRHSYLEKDEAGRKGKTVSYAALANSVFSPTLVFFDAVTFELQYAT
jgi:hypothetical protein